MTFGASAVSTVPNEDSASPPEPRGRAGRPRATGWGIVGRIVWIASYPKSGNTWVRAFLHALIAPGPFDLARLAETAANEAAAARFTAIEPRPWADWTDEDVARVRPLAQTALANGHDRDVLCKTHLAVMRHRGRPTIETAVTRRAVYVVRNPLDVAVSYADHQGLPLDRAIGLMNLDGHISPATATHAPEPMGSWSQHVASWTGKPGPALHVLRYEDLHDDPVAAFSDLVAFLRLAAPAKRVRRAAETVSFEALARREARTGFAERSPAQARFFRSGRAGAWCRALTPVQAARVVEAHRGQMARFGYLGDAGARAARAGAPP